MISFLLDIQIDKLHHLIIGAVITQISQIVFYKVDFSKNLSTMLAIIIGVSVGIIKEFLDLIYKSGNPSMEDFVFTTIGTIGAAILMWILMNIKK